MNINKLSNKEKIINACQLPKDVCLGASLITITGTKELIIENFRNILKLTTEEVILQCKHYKISVSGVNLEIKAYSKEEIIIIGIIKELKFL